MTLEEAQKEVDSWIKTYGVRYFSCPPLFVLLPVSLFFVFSVHTYSNRPVVQKFNFHVCSEFSGSYFFA